MGDRRHRCGAATPAGGVGGVAGRRRPSGAQGEPDRSGVGTGGSGACPGDAANPPVTDPAAAGADRGVWSPRGGALAQAGWLPAAGRVRPDRPAPVPPAGWHRRGSRWHRQSGGVAAGGVGIVARTALGRHRRPSGPAGCARSGAGSGWTLRSVGRGRSWPRRTPGRCFPAWPSWPATTHWSNPSPRCSCWPCTRPAGPARRSICMPGPAGA